MVGLTWRLLARHWPALLAWYLAGTLGRYIGLEVAGYVGGYTALGGMLLLPLAILAKLISIVAMFLTLRDGMVRLGAIAPPPTDPLARRRAFSDALLSSILPFMAVYAALGFMRDDVATYLDTALQVQSGRSIYGSIVERTTVDISGSVDQLTWEPWTLAVVVLAFAGRWAWGRWRAALPRWTAVPATYLEGLWVFLATYFVGEALGEITTWVQSRRAIAWLGDIRATVGEWFAPVGWAWDAIGAILGEIGGLIGEPLAWLTIAGVVYGQAVAPQGVQFQGALVRRARERYGAVPQRLRRRLADLGSGVGSRFQPIWRALVLMWRGGPILIGGYVLAYVLLMLLQELLRIAVFRAVGPQDVYEFWRAAGGALLLIAPLVIEPIRTALVAGAYDATVGALIGAPVVASGRDDESDVARQLVRDRELDAERTDDVVGDDVRHLDREGPVRE
ncbi:MULTISPECIES: hypothetical protein [unclassified Microbacterium]|uniref:hypothetical protein n=1 Tax=unclassified Microbacterium TaxID=2609290 RepID=UPI002002E3C6|nr:MULTISPECIES: hypothetical protein [unclassified Microbacterium]